MKIFILFTLALILFNTFNAFGQNHTVEDHDTHFHPNHIAIFTGATTLLEDDSNTDFTLGVDYVRRFTKDGRWGIGVFGEAIFADHTEWLFGIPAYFYPTNHFWLRAGPALEVHKKEKKSESGMAENTSTETETEFAIRTGLGYDIEVMGIIVSPNFSFDFLRDETFFVWGIHIGKGF